ncbi:MAG TPA: hypothetical protein VLA48_02300 [Nitrososphaeraceae archaeon]|nr:hypothetical protein [Nitrososphaeraceae archaeon]
MPCICIIRHNLFRPASIFCALNFFDKRSSPNTLLIAEKILFQLSNSSTCAHLSNPSSIHHIPPIS